jgi:catechol 2,3-dioxygenase-like lactoylglutathione lyase family enzyme
MPLGRFLEISLAATDVAESLAFYESLGFVQASVGEAWPHPYAVVTDGRLSLGLHGADFASPLPTWVAPSLRARLAALATLDVTIDEARLDDVSLHQALLRDPSGQPLRLLEARTFSPPVLSPAHSSALGYFEEFAFATPDLAAASAFWERVGFVAFEPVREPFARAVAASRDLNVGLYAIDLQVPVLVFTDAAMPERIASLRDQGHRFAQRMPRELMAIGAAMLEAPEGTQLLLLKELAAG